MASSKKITFSKEYVMEIAVSELRKKHSIPEDYAIKVRDYGDEFISFVEVQVEKVISSENQE